MMEDTKNRDNYFLIPLYILINILKLAKRGMKFVFFESFRKKDREIDKSGLEENKANIHVIKHSKFNNFYNNLWFVKQQNAKYEKMAQALQINLQNEGSVRTKEPRVFQYVARNRRGKIERGTINGYSKLDVNTFLLQEGYIVYDIVNNKTVDFFYGDSSILSVRMSNKDLLFWLTQLSTYIKSGITLTEAVKILNNQMKKKTKYRKYFQSLIYELTMGQPFSKALEKQGTVFPQLLINMIRAAEATGELESTLEDMANYYEEMEQTRKQMVSALTYPTIILVFALGVITFILLYVIPSFVKVYEANQTQITGLTLAIINFSNYLKNNILYIVLIVIIACMVIYFAYLRIKSFRKNLQYFLMHVPVIGKIIIYNEITIFTKTFSSLLANNVFITDSMEILRKITNNEIYKDIMDVAIRNIMKGEKISVAFKNHWAVPDVAYYMIVTGESTGQLAEMMKKVSMYYAEMHKSLVNNLKSFIEPIMIAFLAVIVGFIIIAVIVPMFGMMDSIQNMNT